MRNELSAQPKRVRNRRSPWAVHGELSGRLRLLLACVGFAVPLLAWLLISVEGWADPVFLPPPWQVAAQVADWYGEGELVGDILVSISRVLGGFLLSAVIAVPLGVLIATCAPVRALLEPLTEFSRYLPAVAFIPLIMLWVGIDESAKIAVIWVGVFFQMVLMIAEDVVRVPAAPVEAARTMGASNEEIIRHVLIPAAKPAMLTTLRSAMCLAWTYLVVAELVAANSGLGFAILKAQRFLQTDRIFTGILLIGLIGLLTDQGFRWLHRRCFPWYHLRG
ncbi:ABC transporter permease subunit [Duganella sp. FT94W]|uniref:ABC transporter permease subunit n=1 Tax=Duganella lactea TaxID=2692173 RepID=A0ABW9VDU1_9BURK|nr:ABC transporter permease [Duganella lactea]MYM35777.1 ABC transporter permease subunit [Duganella lactea]